MSDTNQSTNGVETIRVNDYHVEKHPDGSIRIREDVAFRSVQTRQAITLCIVFSTAMILFVLTAKRNNWLGGHFLPGKPGYFATIFIFAALIAFVPINYFLILPRYFLRGLTITTKGISVGYGKDSTATGAWANLLRVHLTTKTLHFADGSAIKLPSWVFTREHAKMVFASTPIRDQLLDIINQRIRLSYWFLPIPILITVSFFMIPVLFGKDVFRENKVEIQCVYAVIVWSLVVAVYAFSYAWDKRHGVIRQQETPDHE